MSDQRFVYTCTGSEGTDFNVLLPAARADDVYQVVASIAGATSTFGIDLPDKAANDRQTTQFRVTTTAAPQDGDRIEFFVFDPLTAFAEGTRVDVLLNALLAAQVRSGGWGARLELPAGGPFYLEDTIKFTQVAAQELIGQGARATRFVWRGPNDRPAFDFNRCQDCRLGYFSLEVADSVVGTDKSVSSLTCSGSTATVTTAAAHGFMAGQAVFVSGAAQTTYNGRHVVTSVPTSTTFTYEVMGTPTTPATGTIVAALAATLQAGVRFYNSDTVLLSPSISVSSVDTNAGTLSFATSHPFVTGSPVRLTGSVPRGLATGTDYWVIQVSDTSIALATRFTNALAGIKINIMSSGGSHSVIARVVRNQLSSKNHIEHALFLFDGRAADGVRIVWDPVSSVERGKNDHHRLTNVQIQGYSDSGIVFQGDQPQDCVFDHCIIQGRDTGLYGIFAARPTSDGIYRTVGFFFRDGTIMENQLADIYYARNYGDLLLVDGCHSEGSVRFFDMPNFEQDMPPNGAVPIDSVSISLRNVKHHAVSSTTRVASVVAGSDELNLESAHAWSTGKGPLRLTTTLGDLPAGLFTNTDYWAIVVDTDTIKLATSLANALAGTAVDFTDAGTGTHTVWAPEAAGEAVRVYANGPVTIENCAFGKLNEQANVYRIRVQPRPTGIRPRFTFDSIVSQADESPVFTGITPTRYSGGYRHRSHTTDTPLIDAVDNGRQKPVTEEDWLRVLGIVPRSWWRFGETPGSRNFAPTDVSAGNGEIIVANHGWQTGDGPVRLTTTGTDLPAGLFTDTDYWIIRDDVNTIALGASRSNSLRNMRVNIIDQGTGAHTIKDGSDGKIYDGNTRLPPIDLVPNAYPRYRQARSGFKEVWAEFTDGTIDQQFYLDSNSDVDPTFHSVAFLIHFGAVSSGADNRYLVTLGSGSVAAGSGPNVTFTSGSRMKGTMDGVVSPTGTYNYGTAGDYLLVAGYDRSRGGLFTMETEKELIVHGTPSLRVSNVLRKGIGTGSTGGSFLTAGFQVGLFAVFVGTAAEQLIAKGNEVHRRMGWSVTSNTETGKYGDRVWNLHPFAGIVNAGWVPNSNGYMVSTGPGDFYLPIPLKRGDRIRSVAFARYGTGAQLNVALFRLAPDGTNTTLGGWHLTFPNASWADDALDPPDTTISEGDTLWVAFQATAASTRVGSVRVKYDRPYQRSCSGATTRCVPPVSSTAC